jgi:hypothetical protein
MQSSPESTVVLDLPRPRSPLPGDPGDAIIGPSAIARWERPGACSIDVMAVVHMFKFWRGPSPSRGGALQEALELGLVTTSPPAVTELGERALAEHGWLPTAAGHAGSVAIG